MLIQARVTVNILYYQPAYKHLLQSFIWQTDDIVPEIPRIHKLLNYWKDNIDAVISEVLVSHSYKPDWRKVDWNYKV